MPQVRSAGLALHLLGVKLVPGRRQATTHDRWAAGSARFVFQILRLFQVFTRLEMPQVRSAGLALHLLGQIGARPSAGNNPRSMGRRLGVDGPLTPHAEKMQRSFAALRMTAGPKCRTMLAPLERPQGLRGEPCATETQPIIVTQHEKPRTLKTEVRATPVAAQRCHLGAGACRKSLRGRRRLRLASSFRSSLGEASRVYYIGAVTIVGYSRGGE